MFDSVMNFWEDPFISNRMSRTRQNIIYPFWHNLVPRRQQPKHGCIVMYAENMGRVAAVLCYCFAIGFDSCTVGFCVSRGSGDIPCLSTCVFRHVWTIYDHKFNVDNCQDTLFVVQPTVVSLVCSTFDCKRSLRDRGLRAFPPD